MHGLTLVSTFVERIRKRRLTQTYYIPKWSSDQARLHAGVSGPLPPTSPTPGAPTSFTPPSRASGTLLYGNNKHKNDPLTLFFKNRQTLHSERLGLSTSSGAPRQADLAWLFLPCFLSHQMDVCHVSSTCVMSIRHIPLRKELLGVQAQLCPKATFQKGKVENSYQIVQHRCTISTSVGRTLYLLNPNEGITISSRWFACRLGYTFSLL